MRVRSGIAMKTRAWVAALSVALAGCTATKQTETVSTPPAPPPVAVAGTPEPSARPARSVAHHQNRMDESRRRRLWRIRSPDRRKRLHDDDRVHAERRQFLSRQRSITFLFHADCAKWDYMLRAYYASKNGLPFSYVDKIASDVRADPDTPRHPIGRWSATTSSMAGRA